MLICDNGLIREMTKEEKRIADNLPNPNEQVTDADKAEAFEILMGVKG